MNMHRLLPIQFTMKPHIYEDPDLEAELSQRLSQRSRRQRQKPVNEKYNGIINEGTTCYMNSLLQTLYITRAFRRAVYQMPTDVDDYKSIPFCLQRIFYNLQTGKGPVRTIELLSAFGWSQ